MAVASEMAITADKSTKYDQQEENNSFMVFRVPFLSHHQVFFLTINCNAKITDSINVMVSMFSFIYA